MLPKNVMTILYKVQINIINIRQINIKHIIKTNNPGRRE